MTIGQLCQVLFCFLAGGEAYRKGSHREGVNVTFSRSAVDVIVAVKPFWSHVTGGS